MRCMQLYMHVLRAAHAIVGMLRCRAGWSAWMLHALGLPCSTPLVHTPFQCVFLCQLFLRTSSNASTLGMWGWGVFEGWW
jgi:hypothetical protein